MADRIYLDYAATTPLAPEVRSAMEPWLDCGNPSSLHLEGRRARQAIDEARETVSSRLGCSFGEVVFSSSGTEAANMAILGAALGNQEPARGRILFSSVEHHCVLHTSSILKKFGYQVELIPVNGIGQLDLNALEGQLGPDVLLVSAMHINNEIGTAHPNFASMCRRNGALIHRDAVQSFGWYPWTVSEIDADLISVSGHKLYGPKGVGALFIRAGTKIQPLSVGGGQEREMRAGTENVAAIVGFGEAVRQMTGDPSAAERRSQARDAFLQRLSQVAGGLFALTAPPEVAAGSHAHLRFPGISAESMLILLDRMQVSASSGAACSSGSLEPSHVMLACGYTEAETREGLRFTFGRETTKDEATRAAEIVAEAADQISAARKR